MSEPEQHDLDSFSLPPAEPGIAATPTPADVSQLSARYEILMEVGRGGMGVVYKARDRETAELVALKLLRPEIATDPAVMQRFKNELRLARKITHKNVCRLHEFNRVGNVAYISMEFVEGESLRDLLKRKGSPDLATSLDLVRQIAEGLREAHSQGVIHRDLKPENVLVSPAGQVKVMDFGIARSVEASNTQTATLIGTPTYMAPEQARGQHADHRSDIYSFGLILYEMVTGAPAFRADTPMAMLLQQIQDAPRPPQEVIPTLPAPVSRLILRCLEKDPLHRFASVNELLEQLTPEALEEGKPLNLAEGKAHPEQSNAVPEANLRVSSHGLSAEAEYALPRGLARSFFLSIQFGYLVMYSATVYNADALDQALTRLLFEATYAALPVVIVSAMCGVAVRLYLLSSVALDHPATGAQFRRLFPALFLLDTIWSISPLLLAQKIGYGLSLVSASALIYLPFAQRTLMQSISAARHREGQR